MLRLAPLDAGPIDFLTGLFNDPRVRKHMPLAGGSVDAAWTQNWIAGKQRQWPNPDSGPWSVWSDDVCLGWAGVQPNDDETNELAIVLAHSAWGHGIDVAHLVMRRWNELGDPRPVLVFLPLTRDVDALAQRFQWNRLADTVVDGITFATFRIT